ncbi:MAG TPA: polyhydroxyalkanoic acid system family protein [Arenimonas sp.]|nr:polyhydroxyalkanoic acid system family protein [Arenimonas sp.]
MHAIDIKRTHNLELAKAKKAVQKVANHIADKFDVECEWNGNTLNFQRSGVDGHIKVNPKSIHVFADLGFFLSALKSPIEREINRYLDEEFS